MPGATGAGGVSRQLYVAGLTSRTALQQQAMRVPAAWIVAVALPIMLLVWVARRLMAPDRTY